MPSPAYATITSQTQGLITQNANTLDSIGNSYQVSQTDKILVLAYKARVALPRDPQSGQPAGLRMFEPAQILTNTSRATPLLWQAAATGDLLQITIHFYRTAMTGQQETYFTIAYTDCMVVEGRTYIPAVPDPRFKTYPHMDLWDFTYASVVWTHDKAGTSGSDSWRTTV